MNKHTKTILVFALVLIFALSAALLAACDKDKDPSTTTYTVTVTCDDASALANVKVQLNKADGTSAAEAKALENGKATFDLAPADYTATLTGVPSGYQFENGSLTATTTACTIVLTATRTYTVTLTYPDVTDVYGNKLANAGAASGVTVAMYEGELTDDTAAALAGKTPAATATTDATGKATFNLTGDLYTVVLSGYLTGLHIDYPQGKYVLTVDKTAPDKTVTFTLTGVPGATTAAPLELQLGANEIPLTNEALEKTGYMGVCYSFTPDETGNYTYTMTGNGVMLEMDGFTPVMTEAGSTVVALTAGQTYIYKFNCEGAPAPFTFTIAKGGELAPPSGGDSDYDGEGTLDEPYILTTLAGTVTFTVTADSPVYFAYTATANETYTISSTDTNIFLEIFTKHEPEDDYDTGRTNLATIRDGSLSYDLVMTTGTTYYFSLDYMEGTHETSFTGTLKGNTPPPTSLNTYTVTMTYPELHDVFNNVAFAGGPATGVTVALYAGELEGDSTEDIEDLTAAATATTDATGKATFQLEGETYTIVVSNLKAGYALNYRAGSSPADWVTVFTVTKTAPDRTLSLKESAQVGSSDELPLTIETGETEIAENSTNDLYFAFTPATSGNYTFETTADATLIAKDLMIQGEGKFVRTLQANTTYILNVFSFDACTLKITAGGDMKDNYPWTAGEGTVEAPYQETELKEDYRGLYVPANAPFYFTYTPAEDETYDFEATSKDAWLEIYDDTEAIASGRGFLLQLYEAGSSSKTTGTLTLTASTKYYFKIGTWTDAAGLVSFTATKQTAQQQQPAPEDLTDYQPTGGDGTITDPHILTTLQAKYTFTVADENSKIYLAYTPAQTETWIFATEDADVWLTIFTKSGDDINNIVTICDRDNTLYYELELTGGTQYFLEVDAWDYTDAITFMIYAKATSAPEEGSAENPFSFEPFEGQHTITITESETSQMSAKAVPVWYEFTATETATYTITDNDTDNAWVLICDGTPDKDSQALIQNSSLQGEDTPGSTTITLEAGHTYYFWICTWMEGPGTVSITITKTA